jgi:hypothetical protein
VCGSLLPLPRLPDVVEERVQEGVVQILHLWRSLQDRRRQSVAEDTPPEQAALVAWLITLLVAPRPEPLGSRPEWAGARRTGRPPHTASWHET